MPASLCQLRYASFATSRVEAGGHTTRERHEHLHAVMVVQGGGSCLVGDQIYDLDTHDLSKIPSLTWHQFRAHPDQALGFLCMVNSERDRPQLPTADDLARLRQFAAVAEFIRV